MTSQISGTPTDDGSAARTVIALAIRDESLAAALTARLEDSPDFVVLRCTAGKGAQIAVRPEEIRADVVLLDARWLNARLGPGSAPPQPARWHGRRVLIVAERACADLAEQVVSHRLQGFMLAADAAEVCTKAVRAVSRGETWMPRGLLMELLLKHVRGVDETPGNGAAGARLTRRETEVVGYVRRGFANKQIADSLAIREDTVKKHLQNAYAKLGVHRRSEIMTGNAERTVSR
jgi:DNA-binding NarL/FixJ family response regulator